MLSILTRALMMSAGGGGPEFLGYSAATASKMIGVSLTIDKPDGVQEGDLMIAVMASSGGGVWDGDTGWTELADQGANPRLRIAWKLAGASEAADYTFTPGSSGNLAGQILAFRGSVFDAIGTIATLTANGDLDMPGVTAAGGFLMAAVAARHTSATLGAPTGMTATEAIGLSNVSLCAFVGDVAAGATGTRTSAISDNGGTDAAAGVLIAVKGA